MVSGFLFSSFERLILYLSNFWRVIWKEATPSLIFDPSFYFSDHCFQAAEAIGGFPPSPEKLEELEGELEGQLQNTSEKVTTAVMAAQALLASLVNSTVGNREVQKATEAFANLSASAKKSFVPIEALVDSLLKLAAEKRPPTKQEAHDLTDAINDAGEGIAKIAKAGQEAVPVAQAAVHSVNASVATNPDRLKAVQAAAKARQAAQALGASVGETLGETLGRWHQQATKFPTFVQSPKYFPPLSFNHCLYDSLALVRDKGDFLTREHTTNLDDQTTMSSQEWAVFQ